MQCRRLFKKKIWRNNRQVLITRNRNLIIKNANTEKYHKTSFFYSVSQLKSENKKLEENDTSSQILVGQLVGEGFKKSDNLMTSGSFKPSDKDSPDVLQ